MKSLLAGLARYHGWAFERLAEALSALPDEVRQRPCGLFFGSIDATLDHVSDVDLLWYRRIAPLAPTLHAAPQSDQQSAGFPDRPALPYQDLSAQAARWRPLIESIDAARLAEVLEFTGTDGRSHRFPLGATIAHVFNHATHHRGQIVAAMTAAGHDAPELDLFRMLADGVWLPPGAEARTATSDAHGLAVRDACVEIALDAWEDAGIRGLCAEGRWEVAIGAIQSLDPREVAGD